jgi:threonine dehydrogenase-like Zn-dependent dehydrogenase
MKALVFHGTKNVAVEEMPDPVIKDPKDVIVRITSTAICGSDLHIYGGLIPTVMDGDILGHEFMGEVVEVGGEVTKFKAGDRVIVPFIISCGECEYCKAGLTSLCDRSNPNQELGETVFGYATAGFYGYSHMFGGYCGGQAELARVPFADASIFKVPDGMPDEQALFLTDIFPTGYMAAVNAGVKEGDTVAIWGAGPVGQFAIRSAFMLGAARVIAIDRFPERLAMAREAGAETLNYEDDEMNIPAVLKDMTGGYGPNACIDAVGMEAHGAGTLGTLMNVYDKAKQAVMLESDRPIALREIIYAARKGSTISIPGVYGGLSDKFPMGIAFNKGLTFKMGQTHVQSFVPELMKRIENGDIDPSFVITHRMPLADAAEGYRIFRDKEDACVKVVLAP